MRVLYLSSAQIPSRSTNALQVMRMCDGFRRAGADVTLVHPRRIGNRPEGYDGDLWKFYGIAERFPIVSLPTPLTRRAAQVRLLARPVEVLPLAAYLAYVGRPGAEPFVAYARSLMGAWLVLKLRGALRGRSSCRGLFVELHDTPSRDRDWDVLRHVDGIVVISAALRERLIDRAPELAERMWVEHDGVDLRLFGSDKLDRAESRRRLGLLDELVAVYTGRVNVEKGAGVLLDAAALLEDWKVLLVGRVYEKAFVERDSPNVIFLGFVPPADVPTYLAAADALVLPSTQELPYAAFTSPLKLFEYMASGRPVVAADLPVFREVLTPDRNALVYAPSDSHALADQLTRLREDSELGPALGKQARVDVQQFEWERRATRILERLTRRGAVPLV